LATTPEDHAIVGEALERIVSGIDEEVRIGLHVCYGDYSRIYPEINDYPIDEFDVELCNGDFEQIPTFTDPEFEPDLALGVVDAHTAEIESVEEIKANIRQGLRVVPPEKLTISPDCGLKLLREIAYGKTENMVTAAREVEAEIDSGGSTSRTRSTTESALLTFFFAPDNSEPAVRLRLRIDRSKSYQSPVDVLSGVQDTTHVSCIESSPDLIGWIDHRPPHIALYDQSRKTVFYTILCLKSRISRDPSGRNCYYLVDR